MSSELASKSCIPPRAGIPPLTMDAAGRLLEQLEGWEFEQGRLVKTYRFPDFAQALSFVAQIGAIAEREDHHPEVYLSWGKVAIELWTHKVEGLTESDFILAAKFDQVNAATPPVVPPAAPDAPSDLVT